MDRTRILLGRLPPILADLVRQLLGEEAEIWDLPPAGGEDLLAFAGEVRADVVVVTMGDDITPAGISRRLNERFPGIPLVVVDARGSAAERYVNGHVESVTHDLSPRSLRALLRQPRS